MIGALRYQIDILEREEAPDGAGGAAVSWSVAKQVWAAVQLLTATPALIGERTRRLRRIKALVRTTPDYDIGGRIRIDGDDFEITSVESDDERGRRVYLICEEAVQ